MRLAKLTFLLVVALVAYQAQCPMSCSANSSSSSPSSQKLPPCHRQHDDSQPPAPCSHQAISAKAFSPSLTRDFGQATSAGLLFMSASSFELRPSTLGDFSFKRIPPPPALISLSSFVLRI
jgi:hypothetical protein